MSSSQTYECEARELFLAFARRHGLSFEEDREAPVELLWRFPVQPGLRSEIVLGLQNGDELNFGIEGFWSYFFPYLERLAEFNRILDAWMSGGARILMYRWCNGTELQIRSDDGWRAAYTANGFPFKGRVTRIILNRDEDQNSST